MNEVMNPPAPQRLGISGLRLRLLPFRKRCHLDLGFTSVQDDGHKTQSGP